METINGQARTEAASTPGTALMEPSAGGHEPRSSGYEVRARPGVEPAYATVIAAALSAALGACAPIPYTKAPQIDRVSVVVVWSTPAQIRARCGLDKLACATLGTLQLAASTIWAERPESFDDQRVCTLGHEFLHSLGASHEK